MANNTITINFRPCEPSPAAGYTVRYRPQGSLAEYRVWPVNFFSSPIVITDTNDALGTQYEGFLLGDCGGGKLGVPVPWHTEGSGPVDSGSEGSGSSISDSVSESDPGPVCHIYQNTGGENAVDVSWIDCEGIPHTETITPGSNFCAQVDSLSGEGIGLMEDLGPC